MPAPEFITIGAYGWDAERFFSALVEAGVDTFCDIRQRRGVRGPDYVFANSRRLQARLAELGIRYLYCRELAPSQSTRIEQYAADKAARTSKRLRTGLSPAFVEAYRRERLAAFDSAQFLASLGTDVRVVALFCVERDAQACHRSLLTERLAGDLGAPVKHITP